MDASPTVAVEALGCKANQEEMDCLLSRLRSRGYRVVPFGQAADWTIVNTCTVTAAGDSDSRQAARKAARNRHGGRVVVTGCSAQRDPTAFASIPGVDWVLGNSEKAALADWILDRGTRPSELLDPSASEAPTCARALVRDPSLGVFASFGDESAGRRTRATLKVQDGCDEHCTFCVIPEVRGRSRSRGLPESVAEARRLVASGHREIALTGINTALWGRDLEPPGELPQLVHSLVRIEGLLRLRLNSLEPQYVTPEWLRAWEAEERIARHFHYPLQSGSDSVLKRMNRRYTTSRYAELAAETRARFPGAALGADVLVGFPGETESEFDTTCRFLERIEFAYLHVFTYSARPGTGAPRLGAVPPREVVRSRGQRLRELDQLLRARFGAAALGREAVVIAESRIRGEWSGITGDYLRVRFQGPSVRRGDVCRVRLEAQRAPGLLGARLVQIESKSSAVPEARFFV